MLQNKQNHVGPPKTSTLMVMSPEESTPDSKLQITIINLLKNLRKDMTKFQNKSIDQTTKQLNEIRKTIQDMEAEFVKEIGILKKIKTEVNFAMKN